MIRHDVRWNATTQNYDTIAEVEAEPECGVDFCDRCGDCLHCSDCDPCITGGSGDDLQRKHVWIRYCEDNP